MLISYVIFHLCGTLALINIMIEISKQLNFKLSIHNFPIIMIGLLAMCGAIYLSFNHLIFYIGLSILTMVVNWMLLSLSKEQVSNLGLSEEEYPEVSSVEKVKSIVFALLFAWQMIYLFVFVFHATKSFKEKS